MPGEDRPLSLDDGRDMGGVRGLVVSLRRWGRTVAAGWWSGTPDLARRHVLPGRVRLCAPAGTRGRPALPVRRRPALLRQLGNTGRVEVSGPIRTVAATEVIGESTLAAVHAAEASLVEHRPTEPRPLSD